MSPFFKIIFIFFLCPWDCNQASSKELRAPLNDFPVLLKKATDNKNPLQVRLDFALKAFIQANNHNDRKEKLDIEMVLATIYLEQGQNLLAKEHFQKAIQLSRKLSDQEDLAIALNNIGIIYHNESAFDSALAYYRDANVLFNTIGNKKYLAQNLINIGMIYKLRGNYEEAFKISLEGVHVLQNINEKNGLASALTTVASILKDLNRQDDALHYHELALQIRKQENDSEGIAISLSNIGNVYLDKKNYKIALHNYIQALSIKEKINLSSKTGNLLSNIGQCYFELIDYPHAEKYFKKAVDLCTTSGDKEGLLTTSIRLSKLYISINKFKEAEILALHTQSVLPTMGFLKSKLENGLVLSEIYKRTGRIGLALDYANYALQLKDSLFNSEIADAVSRMNVQFKTEQKEKELRLSKQLQKEQSDRIYTQTIFIVLLVLSLSALFYIVFLLYRSNKTIKRSKKEIELLMSELNHRVKNNLQIISDLLHLQLQLTDNSEQIAMIQASINRIESMQIIHTLLYRKDYNGTIYMPQFIEAIVSNLNNSYEDKSKKFRKSINVQDLYIDINKAIPVGLIVNEIITNVYKYSVTFKRLPEIIIRLKEQGKCYKLQIIDNSEPWDIEQAKVRKNGLGLFIIEKLIKQLNGTWNSLSNNEGTTHSIEFSK